MKQFSLLASFYFIFLTIGFAQETINIDSINRNLEEKINLDKNYLKKIDSLKELAKAQHNSRELEKVTKTYKTIYGLVKQKKDTANFKLSALRLIFYYAFSNQHKEVLHYAQEMEGFLDQNNENNYFTLARAKYFSAMSFSGLEQYHNALENYFETDELLKKCTDKTNRELVPSIVKTKMFISNIYLAIDDHKKALKNIDLALEVLDSENFLDEDYKNELIGSCILSRSDIHWKQENFETFLKSIMKANSFYVKAKDTLNMAMVECKLGKYYDKKKNHKKAIKHFKRGIEYFKQKNRLDVATTAYELIGNSHRLLNQKELALKYVDSALTIAKENNIVSAKIEALITKAKMYEDEKEYKLALKTFNSVLVFDNAIDYQETFMNIYKSVHNLYKKTNETEKSAISIEKHFLIKEKLFEKKMNNKIKILEVEYNYRNIKDKLKKNEIALQLTKANQERIKTKNYIILASIIFLSLFIIIMVIRQRTLEKTKRLVLESQQEVLKIKKESLDREVTVKNKSLTDFALLINEKNSALDKIRTELKKVKPRNDRSKNVLLDTMVFINNDINENTERILLYSQIDEQNDEFEVKISDYFKELTDKEKRIAIMIRTGKTSKQIAMQLNISGASVDNYRHSIRKKLDLPKGKSLGHFIKSI